jgi:hypothetical protein
MRLSARLLQAAADDAAARIFVLGRQLQQFCAQGFFLFPGGESAKSSRPLVITLRADKFRFCHVTTPPLAQDFTHIATSRKITFA